MISRGFRGLQVLANSFVESMLTHGVMPWTDEKLDDFVGLLSPSQEPLKRWKLVLFPYFWSSKWMETMGS